MSLRAMLKQRASIKRLQETDLDGAPVYNWIDVADAVPCLADTYYARAFSKLGQRGGYRGMGIPEAARPAGRMGQLIVGLGSDLKPGDRVVITNRTGTLWGTFEVEDDVQVVPDRHGMDHHIEAGITEVARALGRM